MQTSTRTAKKDPAQMLRADHKKVKALFDQFEKTGSDEEKETIARTAINELKIHSAIEEEIFYPALREQAEKEEETEVMDEAEEEHHVVHLLIDELDGMEA